MINTVQANNHNLWNQIVRKETEVRRNYEYLTGETLAKKFYNGSNATNVELGQNTYKSKFNQPQQSEMAKSILQESLAPIDADGKSVRYNSLSVQNRSTLENAASNSKLVN